MDFWQVFWSVYPGTVLGSTVFFARYQYWLNRFSDRDTDRLTVGECTFKGFILALVWPFSFFFGGLMHHMKMSERREFDAARAKAEARQQQVHDNRIFAIAHRTVRERYLTEHAKWVESFGDAFELPYSERRRRYYGTPKWIRDMEKGL